MANATLSDDTTRPARFGHDHVTVIRPRAGWRGLDAGELWAYRELIAALVARDVRIRYKQTVLGAAWAIIQPVVSMLIFTVIFGRLASIPSDGHPYSIFVYSALLPWMLFSGGVTACSQSLAASADLVSKVYFPRVIVPLASMGSALVDYAVAASVLVLLMLWHGTGVSAGILVAPLLLVGVIGFTLGVGLVLSALTVTYRDFRFVIPFMLQIWMFLTPVVYSVSLIPERWQWLLLLNPMTGYITGLRAAFLGGEPDAAAVAASVLLTALVLVAGVAFFQRAERRFADVI